MTNWIVGSAGIIWQVLNLYLRDLGIDYITLGFLYSIMTIVFLLGNLVASYLADDFNRRNLAIITMALNGPGYLILAFAMSFEMVALDS